jgi:hypothetical protein
VQFALEPEAEATGLNIEAVRARRAERKAKLKQHRGEVAERIKSGELHPLAYPPHLLPIGNRDRGWQDPVPIRRFASYSGAKCSHTLRDFLPVDAVGPMPAFNYDEEIDRALDGRFGDYTCCLDEDWRFGETEADAWRRVGHEYNGRLHSSIGEIVVRAVHDLEAAFERSHPDAPCQAVADFWCSWQVQRHIADFCARLAASDTARLLAGNACDAAEQAERTRVHIYRQLASFAHELTSDEQPAWQPTSPAVSGASLMETAIPEFKQIHLPKPFRFQIALSFPGEYRPRVQKIAELLAAGVGRQNVLYDQWHRAEFARPNLDVYLPKLYREQSRLLVFFHCSAYTQKEWCGLEWRAGRDLLKRNQDDRLMFLRLDDADIPGIYSIDGYIDISRLPDDEVAREILRRLNMLAGAVENQNAVEVDPLAPDIKSARDAEPMWEGIAFQGTYYAWAGPLLTLEDRAAVPCSPQLLKALEDHGIRVSLGNPELLSGHLGRGRCQVFATDTKSWRRPVTRGRQLLLVKPSVDTEK